jgi:uncharacterized protein YjiS (DUF1127 family)
MEGAMPRQEFLLANHRQLTPAGRSLMLQLAVERAQAMRTEYLRGLWRQVRGWWQARTAIAQLRALDDAVLKDIGLHRGGIEAAVKGPGVTAHPQRRAFPEKPHLCLQRTSAAI